MIEANNLKKDYLLGKATIQALRDVNLTRKKSEYLGVCGPSRSRKPTFLNFLGLLDRSSEGQLIFDGVNVESLPKALHNLLRWKVAFIFQSFNLIPVLTARENIEFPLLIR